MRTALPAIGSEPAARANARSASPCAERVAKRVASFSAISCVARAARPSTGARTLGHDLARRRVRHAEAAEVPDAGGSSADFALGIDEPPLASRFQSEAHDIECTHAVLLPWIVETIRPSGFAPAHAKGRFYL
jgi:hypothetical protein